MEWELHQPKQLVLSGAPHLVPGLNNHHVVPEPLQAAGRQRDGNHLGRGTRQHFASETERNLYFHQQAFLIAHRVPCTVPGAEDIKICESSVSSV